MSHFLIYHRASLVSFFPTLLPLISVPHLNSIFLSISLLGSGHSVFPLARMYRYRYLSRCCHRLGVHANLPHRPFPPSAYTVMRTVPWAFRALIELQTVSDCGPTVRTVITVTPVAGGEGTFHAETWTPFLTCEALGTALAPFFRFLCPIYSMLLLLLDLSECGANLVVSARSARRLRRLRIRGRIASASRRTQVRLVLC